MSANISNYYRPIGTITNNCSVKTSPTKRNTSTQRISSSENKSDSSNNGTKTAYGQINTIQGVRGVGVGLNQNPLSYSSFKIEPNISKANPQGSSVLKITDTNMGRIGSNGKPVGDYLVRVDMPHQNAQYNHINTNPNYSGKNVGIYKNLNHKPISNTSFKIAGNANTISKAAKIGGKALCAVAIASDANDIYQSFKKDGYNIGKNTITTSSGVAGSWAGGIGGAKIGAALGSAIGTCICPGIGTAIGGAIGSLLGGIGGSIGGRALGENISKAIVA